MNNEIISLILFLGVILTFIIDYIVITIQSKKHIGQIQRELGPKTHRHKNHTPTLGGIGFVLTFCIIFIITKQILKLEINFFTICFPFISYALLGLYDDLLIIIKKDNEGFSSSKKMLVQVIIAAIYFYILLQTQDTNLYALGYKIQLKWVYGIFILFLFTGFTNATNITDGLDGLLAGCSIISLFGLFICSLMINIEISIIILLLMSTLFGFLIWNYPKAKVFMGNIGSYSIGAFIVTMSILLKLEIFLFIIGGVFIIEVLSVMIQVMYFKITNGKRIFKMAPIHHHFELSGFKEKDVLHMFYIVQIIFVYITIIILKVI